MHHYLSMTRGVLENDLSGERVKLKKYFYALRPVLAAKWIADTQSIPPMEFGDLRKQIPEQFNSIVNELLDIKAKVDESFLIDRHSDLNDFIRESMQYCETKVPVASIRGDHAGLNEFFKKFVV